MDGYLLGGLFHRRPILPRPASLCTALSRPAGGKSGVGAWQIIFITYPCRNKETSTYEDRNVSLYDKRIYLCALAGNLLWAEMPSSTAAAPGAVNSFYSNQQQ